MRIVERVRRHKIISGGTFQEIKAFFYNSTARGELCNPSINDVNQAATNQIGDGLLCVVCRGEKICYM